MAVSESMVGWMIQNDPNLRNRITAIVRNAWWNDPTVVDPTQPIPLEDLAWAVATTKAIRDTVINAFVAKPHASSAIEAITDNQLVTAVVKAMERINAAKAAANVPDSGPPA